MNKGAYYNGSNYLDCFSEFPFLCFVLADWFDDSDFFTIEIVIFSVNHLLLQSLPLYNFSLISCGERKCINGSLTVKSIVKLD